MAGLHACAEDLIVSVDVLILVRLNQTFLEGSPRAIRDSNLRIREETEVGGSPGAVILELDEALTVLAERVHLNAFARLIYIAPCLLGRGLMVTLAPWR